MDRSPRVLSLPQRRELERLVSSRDTPQYIVARARCVLAEHAARADRVPRPAAMSRQTSAKWLARYVEHGVAGLHDAPRAGRPRTLADDDTWTIITAPLYSDSPNWTTRTIAAQTQLSQSAVARSWRRVYRDELLVLGDALPASGLGLDACYCGAEGSILVVQVDTAATASAPADFMRSPLRPALQVILATDIVTTSLPTDLPDTASSLLAFARQVATELREPVTQLALCSSAACGDAIRAADLELSVIEIDGDRWQGLLIDLGERISPQSYDALFDAQQHAREWARSPAGPWTWVRSNASATGGAPAVRRREATPVATGERVTRAIFECLYDEIMAGRLGAGDRVIETYLARRTRTSRGHIRDGLKMLASRGIIHLEPNRGAVVPTPSVDDVVEIYAARRSLGALLVRRAAEAPVPAYLPILEAALTAMLDTAAHGDALATGEQDLKLQEIIAEMAGMQRIASLYAELNDQLRMLVAVLRIRYAYSIPDMCRDNTALVEHIRERKAADAVAGWNAKMNDAAKYMIRQLEPPPGLRPTTRPSRP